MVECGSQVANDRQEWPLVVPLDSQRTEVLWAIFAIAIVGIVGAIIQAYVVGEAGEIR